MRFCLALKPRLLSCMQSSLFWGFFPLSFYLTCTFRFLPSSQFRFSSLYVFIKFYFHILNGLSDSMLMFVFSW
uniref:Uncharacterized protein n=1 Tax=Mus musculus TaxID=10090 RepID=Q3UEB9_MOUSE|nr:unnamed protein product [Mus musculus]